jgi:hypothetical protein
MVVWSRFRSSPISSFFFHNLHVKVDEVFETTRYENRTAVVAKTNGGSRQAERGEDESGKGREVKWRRGVSVDETVTW